ncbi:MAG TPA: alpha/beta family hydrolase [Frankiaceae bacterium]|nr:alpha/beta family hydrolase [Frankiaceae bacterium]
MLLGHGAGGGITTPDLLKVATIAASAGMAVGLVEQPYRVAGRRPPAPAPALDAAFAAVVTAARKALRRKGVSDIPVILGGRSSGARVACRTAQPVGASGVLALAFPLQPPRRQSGHEPPSRLPELLGAGAPVLVVQGERDPFGSGADLAGALLPSLGPAQDADITVITAAGADHSLRKGIDAVKISVWLAQFLP